MTAKFNTGKLQGRPYGSAGLQAAWHRASLCGITLALAACGTILAPPGKRDGEVYVAGDGQFILWDEEQREWLETEAYWRNFAARGPGRNWPDSDRLPPPEFVNERDTILLRTQLGNCLMYFSHGTWQRANDVWKWGEELDHFGGCPHILDTHVTTQ